VSIQQKENGETVQRNYMKTKLIQFYSVRFLYWMSIVIKLW